MLFHLATSDGFGLVKNHHGDQFQAPEAEAVVQTLALTPRGKSRKPPMPNGCKETRNGRERGARDRSQRPRGSDENPRFISGGKMIEFTPWTTFRHAGFNARPAEKVFDQSGDAGAPARLEPTLPTGLVGAGHDQHCCDFPRSDAVTGEGGTWLRVAGLRCDCGRTSTGRILAPLTKAVRFGIVAVDTL